MSQAFVLALLNSEWVQTIFIGAVIGWLVKWLKSDSGSKYKKYEGYMVTAVKAAEKAIPDDTPNKGLLRLDHALQAFVKKYTEATGVKPSEADIAQIESLIAVVHDSLESKGTL